ncbi:MAG: hypothetical protein RIT35_717, partial [Pseudomonadota bacterium]
MSNLPGLESIFDSEYYKNENSLTIANHAELFKHYEQHGIESCSAPNKYFAEHSELFKEAIASGGFTCKLKDLQKPSSDPEQAKILNIYATYLTKELTDPSLTEIKQFQTKASYVKTLLKISEVIAINNQSLLQLEQLLAQEKDLSFFLLKIFNNQVEYKLQPHSIQYLEIELAKGIDKLQDKSWLNNISLITQLLSSKLIKHDIQLKDETISTLQNLMHHDLASPIIKTNVAYSLLHLTHNKCMPSLGDIELVLDTKLAIKDEKLKLAVAKLLIDCAAQDLYQPQVPSLKTFEALFKTGNHDKSVYALKAVLKSASNGSLNPETESLLWKMLSSKQDSELQQTALLTLNYHFKNNKKNYSNLQSGVIGDWLENLLLKNNVSYSYLTELLQAPQIDQQFTSCLKAMLQAEKQLSTGTTSEYLTLLHKNLQQGCKLSSNSFSKIAVLTTELPNLSSLEPIIIAVTQIEQPLPLRNIELLLERYSKDQTYLTKVWVSLLEHEKNLPLSLLEKLVAPVVSLWKKSFDLQERSNALYIINNLFERAVTLPKNIITDLSRITSSVMKSCLKDVVETLLTFDWLIEKTKYLSILQNVVGLNIIDSLNGQSLEAAIYDKLGKHKNSLALNTLAKQMHQALKDHAPYQLNFAIEDLNFRNTLTKLVLKLYKNLDGHYVFKAASEKSLFSLLKEDVVLYYPQIVPILSHLTSPLAKLKSELYKNLYLTHTATMAERVTALEKLTSLYSQNQDNDAYLISDIMKNSFNMQDQRIVKIAQAFLLKEPSDLSPEAVNIILASKQTSVAATITVEAPEIELTPELLAAENGSEASYSFHLALQNLMALGHVHFDYLMNKITSSELTFAKLGAILLRLTYINFTPEIVDLFFAASLPKLALLWTELALKQTLPEVILTAQDIKDIKKILVAFDPDTQGKLLTYIKDLDSLANFKQLLDLLKNITEDELEAFLYPDVPLEQLSKKLSKLIITKDFAAMQPALLPQYQKFISDKTEILLAKGWSLGDVLALMREFKLGQEQILKKIITRLVNLNISNNVIDRNGDNALEIIQNYPAEQLDYYITQLQHDTHHLEAKKLPVLLEEMRLKNVKNSAILKLLDERYFDIVLDDIAKFEKKACYILKLPESKEPLTKNNHSSASDFCKATEADTISIPKTIANWESADFLNWRKTIKLVTDDNIAEVLAVLKQAVFKSQGFIPRNSQILSILTFFKSGADKGRLAEIATGEGKSVIIAMFATLQVLSGEKVDIVTSSSVLAEAGYEENIAFYKLLGITAAHNIPADQSNNAQECYKQDILYGDLLNFAAGTLRDLAADVRYSRPFGILMVDEVDNMCIDNTNMSIQLSGNIAGFRALEPVLVYLWTELALIDSRLHKDQDAGKAYLPVYKAESGKDVNTEVTPEDLANAENYVYIEVDHDRMSKWLSGYLKNVVLVEDKLPIAIPKHLTKFMQSQVDNWVTSILQAFYSSKENQEYIIVKNGNRTDIAPVDKGNTGVIQQNLIWANGLHQFLQIKHGLAITPESLTSIYISYIDYFKHYASKNIYGLTGTLGTEAQQDFLSDTYKVDFVFMPRFMPKTVVEEPVSSFSDFTELKEILYNIVHAKAEEERATLIMVDTIETVQEIVQYLIKQGYAPEKIKTYGTGAVQEKNLIASKLQSGDVIIATQLAGRGADFKISSNVNNHGGLHVVLTSLPDNWRVEAQAFGRAARKGELGSVQLLIGEEQFNKPGYEACSEGKNLECLILKRNKIETEALQRDILCNLPRIKLNGEIFAQYNHFTEEFTSPIGYVIKQARRPPSDVADKILYLSIAQQHVYMTGRNVAGDIINVDITPALQAMGELVYDQVRTIVTTGQKLNRVLMEVIYFIASQQSLHHEESIVTQTKAQYEENIPAQSGLSFHTQDSDSDAFRETAYLQAEFNKQNPGKIPTKADLYKIKLGKLWSLWQTHLQKHNFRFEMQQITENWGKWLKMEQGHNPLWQHTTCDISTAAARTATLTTNEQAATTMFEHFVIFTSETMSNYRNNILMENPSYLVHKALHYHDNIVPDSDKDNIGHFFGFNFNPAYEEAKGFLSRAMELDSVFAAPAYFARGFMQLTYEGKFLKDKDQIGESQLLKNKVLPDFFKARALVTDITIPQFETELNTLLATKLITYEHDLSKQLLLKKEVMKVMSGHHQTFIDLFLTSEGQKVVIDGIISIEEIAKSIQNVNVTIALKPEIDQGTSNTTNDNSTFLFANVTRNTMVNMTINLNMTDHESIVNEFMSEGYFTVWGHTEDLKSDWGDTFASMILGVMQICIGLALAPIAGPLAFIASSAMISQGISDIIGGLVAIATDNPVQLEQWLKGKALGYTIAILAAGIDYIGGFSQAATNAKLAAASGVWESGAGFLTFANLPKLVAIDIAVTVGSMAINSALGKVLDANDGKIEAKVAKIINELLTNHKAELLQMLISDGYYSEHDHIYQLSSLENKLYQEAHNIVKKYQSGLGNAYTAAIGVAKAAAPMIAKSAAGAGGGWAAVGYGLAASAAMSTIDAAINYEHIMTELKKFSGDLGAKLVDLSKQSRTTKTMMQTSLTKQEGEANTLKIMEYLTTQNFVTAQEINYKQCNTISELKLEEFHKTIPRLTQICNHIANHIAADHSKHMAQLQASLSKTVAQAVVSAIKGKVISPIGSMFASATVNIATHIYEEHEQAKKQEEAQEQAQESKRITEMLERDEAKAKRIIKESQYLSKQAKQHYKAWKDANPTPDASHAGMTAHKVIGKDTVYDLAKTYGVSVEEIIETNKLVMYKNAKGIEIVIIKRGATIYIPQKSAEAGSRPDTNSKPATSGGNGKPPAPITPDLEPDRCYYSPLTDDALPEQASCLDGQDNKDKPIYDKPIGPKQPSNAAGNNPR